MATEDSGGVCFVCGDKLSLVVPCETQSLALLSSRLPAKWKEEASEVLSGILCTSLNSDVIRDILVEAKCCGKCDDQMKYLAYLYQIVKDMRSRVPKVVGNIFLTMCTHGERRKFLSELEEKVEGTQEDVQEALDFILDDIRGTDSGKELTVVKIRASLFKRLADMQVPRVSPNVDQKEEGKVDETGETQQEGEKAEGKVDETVETLQEGEKAEGKVEETVKTPEEGEKEEVSSPEESAAPQKSNSDLVSSSSIPVYTISDSEEEETDEFLEDEKNAAGDEEYIPYKAKDKDGEEMSDDSYSSDSEFEDSSSVSEGEKDEDEETDTALRKRRRVQTEDEEGEDCPKSQFPSSYIPKQKRFKCPCRFCPKSYSDLAALNVHLSVVHPQEARHPDYKTYQCDSCSKFHYNSYDLDRHIQVNHPKKLKREVFSCDICSKAFPTAEEVVAHKERVHVGPEPFKCEDCAIFVFPNSATLRNHTKTIHPVRKSMECKICSKILSSEERLQVHQRRMHPEKFGIGTWQCGFCGEPFRTWYILRHHQLKKVGGCQSSQSQSAEVL